MSDMMLNHLMVQAELAYRRERIEATMRQVGPSRRQRRRKAAAEAAAQAAEITVPRPRRSPESAAGLSRGAVTVGNARRPTDAHSPSSRAA
jgi:hypothetical protein